MTDKEVKKLKRAQLLDLLLVQTKRVETLEAELKEAEKKLKDKEAEMEQKLSEKNQEMEKRIQQLTIEMEEKLEDRSITLNKVGSIAEAALALNNVFEAAQQAADQYVENTRIRCDRMEQETIKRCKNAIKKTKAEMP